MKRSAILLVLATLAVALLALRPGTTARARRAPGPPAAEPRAGPKEPPPPGPPQVPAPEPPPEQVAKPGARLVGRVTDDQGDPVPGAGIWLSKGMGPGEGDVVARADGDGRYRYDGVDGETRLVGAIAPKHAPSDLRKIAPATQQVFELDFTLRRGGGTLSIAVAGAESADVFVAPVFLKGADSGGRRTAEVLGTALLEGLAPEWNLVRARAAGRAPRTLLTRLPPEGVVQADVQLGDGAVVFGTATNADGTPASGARIDLVGWEWARIGVVADEAGAYRMLHAPAALVELRATSGDGAEARMLVKLEEGKEQRWDPVLRLPAEITGQVVDESGAPVVPAYLSWWPVGSLRSKDEILMADGEGRFRIEGLPSREYRIAVWWGGTMVPPAAEVTATPGDPPLTITLPRADGFLTGVITDPKGLPAAGTRVRMWPSGSPNRELRVFAATDGSFRVGPLPAGSYVLELHLDGEPTLFRDGIQITAGVTTDLGALRFEAGGHIRARVVDASGAIVDATSPGQVTFDGFEMRVRSLDGSVTYVVDPDGAAVLSEELVPGRYLVSGGMAGILEEADVRANQTTEVSLKLRGGGMLEAAAVLEDGTRTLASYRITDERGHPVPGLEEPVNPLRISLASGSYRVEATGAAGGHAADTVEIPGDGSSTQIALALR